MTVEPLRRTLHHLRLACAPSAEAAATDSELLQRFLKDREDAVLEELLHRHSAMVIGTCRRVLRHQQDAEDAYQATFLILIQRAHTIRKRESLASWLYGVAFRTALKARERRAQQRRIECAHAEIAELECPREERWQEQQRALDEELNRLPKNYRAAIVLCDLQQKTRKEAARELGWPEGTVAGRLARARVLLERRLRSRGITLSTAVLLGLASSPARSPALIRSIVRLEMTRQVPATLAELVRDGSKIMAVAKLQWIVALIVTFGLCGGLLIGWPTEQLSRADACPKLTPVPRPTTLLWKFRVGRPFYQRLTVTSKQDLIVTGKPIEQTQAQTFVYRWTPQEMKDGKVTLKGELVGLKMKLDVDGTHIEYDSYGKKDGGKLKNFFKALLSAEHTMTLDPMKPAVTQFKTCEALIAKLKQQSPNVQDLVQEVKAMREMVAPMFLCTPPGGRMTSNREWTRTDLLELGAIGRYRTTYKFKPVGRAGDNEKIAVAVDLKYSTPSEKRTGGNMVFVIKLADLKSSEGKGRVLFNSKVGRVTEMHHSFRLKGELSIEIGGQVTTVKVDQVQKATCTTSDTPPKR